MLADTVFILAAIALASLVVWWEVLCLTDLAQADRVRFLPRWASAVLCLIQIPLGGVLYLLVGREWRRPAAASGSAGS